MIYASLITLVLFIWKTYLSTRLPSLPKWAQPLPPVVLGLLTACGEGLQAGLHGEALLTATLAGGGQIGVVAIGLWHTAKRVNPKALIASLICLGCAGTPPKLPSQELCEWRVKRSGILEEQAAETGYPIDKLAEDYCELLTKEKAAVP
jgi:hypothetical protein